ncbi:MAG: SagB family peptide dehydrogenase, partial [Vicinamibacterales bacterium]
QTAQRIPISIQVAGVLHELSEWTSPVELRDRISTNSDLATVEETIGLLHALRLVEREGDEAHAAWHEWAPEAAFFHFSTKNGVFPEDLSARDRELVEKAKQQPQPDPTKRMHGARVGLASHDLLEADLASTLAKRRTWRNFSDQPVSAAALGTLLNATFGVQRHGRVRDQGPIILRTSPSGGSRHPIEAYVLALNVDGLAAGVYHYDSEAKELVDLQRPMASHDIAPLLAHQTYFARAAAITIMCPVFARTRWRYGHSRAYRAVLIDAGHLGQTFCLVATALGLAPFTTMAFSESAIEELLGLDGIDECPIYVAGVGMPDPAAAAAPGRVGPGRATGA